MRHRGLIAFARGRAHHRGDDVGSGALGRIGAVTRLGRIRAGRRVVSGGTDLDVEPTEEKKRFSLPSAYTILFALIVLMAIATWIVPAGTYELDKNGSADPGHLPRGRLAPRSASSSTR